MNHNALAWRTAFLLGLGTTLDIYGVNLLHNKDFQASFWLDSFQNAGDYLFSAFANDAKQYGMSELLEENTEKQLEFFG